jgi:hypothetical protein
MILFCVCPPLYPFRTHPISTTLRDIIKPHQNAKKCTVIQVSTMVAGVYEAKTRNQKQQTTRREPRAVFEGYDKLFLFFGLCGPMRRDDDDERIGKRSSRPDSAGWGDTSQLRRKSGEDGWRGRKSSAGATGAPSLARMQPNDEERETGAADTAAEASVRKKSLGGLFLPLPKKSVRCNVIDQAATLMSDKGWVGENEMWVRARREKAGEVKIFGVVSRNCVCGRVCVVVFP